EEHSEHPARVFPWAISFEGDCFNQIARRSLIRKATPSLNCDVGAVYLDVDLSPLAVASEIGRCISEAVEGVQLCRDCFVSGFELLVIGGLNDSASSLVGDREDLAAGGLVLTVGVPTQAVGRRRLGIQIDRVYSD